MAKLVMLALMLSVDSLLVSISLGTLGLEKPVKRTLIFLFAMCDGVASLVGMLLSTQVLRSDSPWPGAFQQLTLCLYLGLLVVFAVYGPIVGSQGRVKLFYALPLLLCLDNLTAGLSLRFAGIGPLEVAAIMAAASALMAWAGMRLGSTVRRKLPIGAATLAGIACVVAMLVLR